MEEPTLETFPTVEALFPCLGRQLEAARLLVGLENALQFVRRWRVGDEEVTFVVEREAAAIQVCRTDEGTDTVGHQDFAVMETAFKEIDLCTRLH